MIKESNGFINEALKRLPKMDYDTARTVMRDFYDQYFEIFNHMRPDAHPWSSDMLHTTNIYHSEDVMRQTELSDLIRNFDREPWYSVWKLDLLQVLSLPVPLFDLMRAEIPLINERRKKDHAASGLDLDL